jgi:hypothetical protein
VIEVRAIAARQIDAVAAGIFIAAASMYQLTDVYGDLGFWFFAKSHTLLGVGLPLIFRSWPPTIIDLGVRVYRLATLSLLTVKHQAQRLDTACVSIGDASGNDGIQGSEPSLALL